jgi:enterochelin esterase-like enzyme
MVVTRKRHLHQAAVLWGLLAACICVAHASEVATFEFESQTLERRWGCTVYLPEGYEANQLRYPVFYLLHGNGQKHSDWAANGGIQATADALIASGKIPPTIIVMPDAGTTWYVDRKEKMETAFFQDLMPEIEARFRTIAARNGRVIGGLSMGGYGALRYVLKYPEKFAAAALLSPAIYDPEPPPNSSARRVGVFGAPDYDARVWQELNYPSLLEAYFAKQRPVPLFIHSGDDDEFLIEADATKLYSLLRARGQPAELRIVDGAHDWNVWRNAIGEAMTYIYRFADRPVEN